MDSSVTRDAIQAWLADHIELILTASGVLFAILLTFAQLDQITLSKAFTFLVWLQGFLIWGVRRHSRLSRDRLIEKLRLMLQDRVNSQLTVLVGMTELRSHRATSAGDVETALVAARTVAQELDGLSLRSLRQWESRYGRHPALPLV